MIRTKKFEYLLELTLTRTSFIQLIVIAFSFSFYFSKFINILFFIQHFNSQLANIFFFFVLKKIENNGRITLQKKKINCSEMKFKLK